MKTMYIINLMKRQLQYDVKGFSEKHWKDSGLLDNVYTKEQKDELVKLLNEGLEHIIHYDNKLNNQFLRIIERINTVNRIIPHIPSMWNAYTEFLKNDGADESVIFGSGDAFLRQYLEGEFNLTDVNKL